MFPLGLAYFVVLTVGVALGIGLVVILVGIPLLIGVILGSRYLVSFERELTNALLRSDIRSPVDAMTDETAPWPQIRVQLVAHSTWKGLVYLLLKLPLGILVFGLLAVALTVSVGLITALLIYTIPSDGIQLGIWTIDTLSEAVIAVPIGVVVLFISLHVFDLVAQIFGKFSTIFFGATAADIATSHRDTT
jgi:hypothetical protein